MDMKKMLAVVAAASLVAVAAPAWAANPFSDVPMNHWAYDAVEQLTAKGVIEGYPDGTFKGNRAMTRYEIATIVARMMANGNVSGADADKLKALIVEFAPELEALGVKVDGFDSRLTSLEKGLGGLRVWGQMRFDIRSFDEHEDPKTGDKYTNGSDFDRARIFMHKDLSDGVSWDMRWNGGTIDRYWLTAKDFAGMKGLTATIGSFYTDWESEDNLHANNAIWDNESAFYDTTVRGADLKYSNGNITVEGLYASKTGKGANGVSTTGVDGEFYGARAKYEAEKFFVSLNGYWFNYEDTAAGAHDGANYAAYWASVGFKFFKGLDVIGGIYTEDISSVGGSDPTYDDSPMMWKIIVDANEDLLKFTSLRLEYAQYDQGWIQNNAHSPFTIDAGNVDINKFAATTELQEDVEYMSASAIQKWGPKFMTYERYGQLDQDVNGKAKEWTAGVGYQYTPNLAFYLDYTDFDGRMGNDGVVDPDYDNKMVRFRTFLNF